jgi:hypothetical protein
MLPKSIRMRFFTASIVVATSVQVLAYPQTKESPGGIFGASPPKDSMPKGMPKGQPEIPKGVSMADSICKQALDAQAKGLPSPFGANGSPIQRPGEKCGTDLSGGSGPYKANYTTDSAISGYTIYAPKTPPPADVKLPVLIWGNGACLAQGLMFMNLLNELASYGFFIIANGLPEGGGTSTAADLTKAIDWVTANPASLKKYGNVDTSNLAVSGQSCGGLEAYSASYKDPRVKLTVLFNSGLVDQSKRPLLADLKAPVAFLLGGPKDIAQANV